MNNRERWSLATPYCRYCDSPKVFRCNGNCPDFKRFRKKWAKKRYRRFLKNRLRIEYDI